jgi:protoporphyrinogen oxidase
LWFWTRFNREKGGGKERKGYIRGGYRGIADHLVASLKARGSIVRLAAPVERLDLDHEGKPVVRVKGCAAETFDRAVLTAPLILLRRMVAHGKLAAVVDRADPRIDMQGVVNAVLMLRRPLSGYYWVAAIDPGIPFQGFVESTNLLDQRDTGGVHLVYLVNYLHRSEPGYARDDGDILREYLAGLHKLFPGLRDDDIVDSFVFRAPFVEPLYTTGYARRTPPHVLIPGRVYLSTSLQVYPNVTSWNGATEVSRAVIERLLAEVQ